MNAKIIITVVAILGLVGLAIGVVVLFVVFGAGFVFYKSNRPSASNDRSNIYFIDMAGPTDNTTNHIKTVYDDNGKSIDGLRVWMDRNLNLPCEIRTGSDSSNINILKNVSYVRLLKMNNGQTSLIAEWGDRGQRDLSQKEMWLINSTDKSQGDFALEFTFQEKEKTTK